MVDMVDLASWFPDSVDLANFASLVDLTDLVNLAKWLMLLGRASFLICRMLAISLDWSFFCDLVDCG